MPDSDLTGQTAATFASFPLRSTAGVSTRFFAKVAKILTVPHHFWAQFSTIVGLWDKVQFG